MQTEGDSCRLGDRSGVRDKGTGGLSFGLETRARWQARHRQTACPKEPLQGDKGSTPRRQRQLAERTRSSEEQPAGGTEMGQLLQQGTHVRSPRRSPPHGHRRGWTLSRNAGATARETGGPGEVSVAEARAGAV